LILFRLTILPGTPTTVELEVTETEPGVKGDTAQGATKAATVETGYTLQVPLFVKEGDVLVLNRTKVIPARLFGKKENGGAFGLYRRALSALY